jgi:hypothetical protein
MIGGVVAAPSGDMADAPSRRATPIQAICPRAYNWDMGHQTSMRSQIA